MNLSDALELYQRPFNDLLFKAHSVHREHFNPNEMQLSSLLSIKTGGCPEDCAYCPQSAHYATGVESTPLAKVEDVLAAARRAKAQGASRFCMGAAWRNPRDKDLEAVCDMISEVKALGLETCATLGMLKPEQAEQLKEAGLDFYNHNIDSSSDFYSKVISTRTFEDRLETLSNVSATGMKVCCGGILGMGESIEDRLKMILTLSALAPQPESVPLNFLIAIEGTPLEKQSQVSPLDFVRLVAVTRILLPRSWIRLAAGREGLSDEFHALCFFAGANSVFLGDKLLTAANPATERDTTLFSKLGLSFHSQRN